MDKSLATPKSMILIVDDEHSVLRGLREFLVGAGYDVRTAATKTKAIKIVHEMRRPAIVVIDWFLKGPDGNEINGKELLESLMVSARYPILPIFMSAHSDPVQAETWALEAGGYNFWDKTTGPALCLTKIQALEKLASTLLHQAMYDSLTSAYTRGEGDRQTIRELERMARKEADRLRYLEERSKSTQGAQNGLGARKEVKIALLMFDCDRFKSINDQFGHPVGDEVLRHIVRVIKSDLRPTDYIARYGGDEFLLVLPETNEVSAQVVANRVIKDVAESQVPNGEGGFISPTVSLGVEIISASEVGTDPKNAAARWQKFCKDADEKMYESKRGEE